MRPQDVIRKKRDRGRLSRQEIEFFVNGVVRGKVMDYQAAALLMAIFFNGMDDEEQRDLTEVMLHSGEVLNFSEIPKPKVDKHSTGGVGDKTSLILAPIVAAAGGCVPMISGRGLGHTGGTLDKLESIPGYRVRLSLAEFRSVLEQIGYAMMGQTRELAPADRTLYALRDATATVEAIPLIVASIMSKKLAAGLEALVLDVKTGTGAFIREEEQARKLARALVATGNSCGVKTEALLTDMNQPLGSAVGHAIEVRECLDLMRGEVDELTRPVLDLSLELAARMLALSGIEATLDAARARAREMVDSGAAFECFQRNVEAQGGDPRACDEPARYLPLTETEVQVESAGAGFVTRVETDEVGRAIAAIGGGRARVEDGVDPAVGFRALARIGDHVAAGEALGLVYARTEAQGLEAAARIRAAYTLSDEPVPAGPTLIKEAITA